MQLRQYQERSLDSLQRYMRGVAQYGAKIAFIEQTERPYREIAQLPALPYVCLRVPTGGGKTIMAAHGIGIAARELLQADTAVCLWLVPSNAILEQTLKALKDREHPYRIALKSRFAGNVAVLNLTEALYVQRETLVHETCVIVCTLAALRVEDTEGRKVYEQNGVLQAHFTGLSPQLEVGLDKHEGGGVVASLANALRLHRPMVIVDEAHNARTGLSFDTLARFSPSCIMEFTATPELMHKPEIGKFASNVLHHVSAAELKAEDMVKLPIMLATHPDWKETLARAVAQQRELERLTAAEERVTGEYLRPIVLVQAQPQSKERQTITVEFVKNALLEDFAIPDEQIAIATGETREIDGIDLLLRICPIRFIITVQALKEGWDCPFAYVLCSVAEQHSARAVEQILGRVLRMPNATRKQTPELNCAYAFVASAVFASAVQSIKDALVETLGFQRIEAEDLVQQPQQTSMFDRGSLFRTVNQVVTQPPDLSKLDSSIGKKVEYNVETCSITIHGQVSAGELDQISGCLDAAVDRQAIVAAVKFNQASNAQGIAPASTTTPISIPLLGWRTQGELELFDEAAFLEATWDLASCDPTIDVDLAIPAGASGSLDISTAGKVETSFVQGVQEQLALIGGESGWTLAKLAIWLDRNISHPDVLQSQSSLFMHKVLTDLVDGKHIGLHHLARRKFALARSVARRIDDHRSYARTQAFQAFLFGGRQSEIEVSAALVFTFDVNRYSPNWYYEGGTQFRKHFTRSVGELKDGGEEWQCAAFLEQHPEVEVWIRNLERRPESSFWLQTSTDRFYPDFVCRLKDGRILVVEYKGSHLWSNDDSKEKRAVGDLWAARSSRTCIFVMPNGLDLAAISKVIAAK